MTQMPSNVDVETGEIVEKAYMTTQHRKYGNEVMAQWKYVSELIRNPNDRDAFTRLSPDTLALMLTELTAYYESAGFWLADEKLHLSDLKLAREFKYNDIYLQYKQRKSETNETARVQAKMSCQKDDEEIASVQHQYDRAEAWRKALGRWHDAARSQLSYEKSMTNFQ